MQCCLKGSGTFMQSCFRGSGTLMQSCFRGSGTFMQSCFRGSGTLMQCYFRGSGTTPPVQYWPLSFWAKSTASKLVCTELLIRSSLQKAFLKGLPAKGSSWSLQVVHLCLTIALDNFRYQKGQCSGWVPTLPQGGMWGPDPPQKTYSY